MNKTYLKVGVAITAAFAFGFVVGQAVLLRKVDELVKGGEENMRAVRDELIFQAERADESEPIAEEKKEEEEMGVLRRLKKMGIIPQTEHEYDVPYEVVTDWFGLYIDITSDLPTWEKARDTANLASADRISELMDDMMENPEPDIMEAIYRIQRGNPDMIVNDITPYNMRKIRTLRFVYIRNANQLRWMLGGWRDNFEESEVRDILIRLMTFSVKRDLESNQVYWTTYTPMMLLDQIDLYLPEDEVELENTRIFYFPDMDVNVEVVIFDRDDTPGRIRAMLEAHAEV